MAEDSKDLQDDIRRLQETLEKDGNQFYDYIVDSDEDSDDEDALYIDLSKHGSAPQSVASMSARSVGATPSIKSVPSTETQSMITEPDDDADMFREVGVVWDKLDSNNLPPTIESSLVFNRAYQDIISEHIGRIELELAENREAQRRLEEEARDSSIQQHTRKRFPYAMTTPYFKMRGNQAPPANEDVLLKKRADEPDLDARPESAWTSKHRRLLTMAVAEDALEKVLQPLLSRRELEEEKLQQTKEHSDDYNKIMDRIAVIDREMEERRHTPSQLLLQSVDTERVDWMKIANITFEGRRDWLSCRRAWQHNVDPRLNQNAMKDDEERKLSQLIEETGATNWVYIAQQLGTGRTAFQCLQYYQQNLNKEMLDRPWTKEEDAQLINVVKKCQQMHFNWNKVSQYMEGRSGMQCYKRFSKLDPTISKGLWTESEDAKLMAAVQLLGSSNWGRIAELVPGRNREQCRERYSNSLDPSISGRPWSYEEDKKLLQQVEIHGTGSWVKIQKELPGRTDNQILHRYRRLEDWKKKSEWFKKQSERDRELLQGNNLPERLKVEAQAKNWEQFRLRFHVHPEDYQKQLRDAIKGEILVPRPPFMIGLANSQGSKMWERRIKLRKLIECHIDRLREKYSFAILGGDKDPLNATVAGVFELQDEIAQLSQECLSQRNKLLARRDELLENRRDRLGLLIHSLPSKMHVKDMLAVTRGKNVHEPQRRGPLPKKKRPHLIAPRLHKSMRVDAELRQVVRANLKDRSLKRGRPRRFFWDLKGEQKLCDEDLHDLKSTTISLFIKSLGADHSSMLVEGRKTYPDLCRKLEAKYNQQDGDDQPTSSTESGKRVRRSRRVDKIKKEQEERPENTDPFSLGDQAVGTPFATWTKQRDYELLEWLARHQQLDVSFQPPPPVSMDEEIPTAGYVDIRTAQRQVGVEEVCAEEVEVSMEGQECVAGHGMSLVQASIQEAMEEREADERRRQGTSRQVNGDDVSLSDADDRQGGTAKLQQVDGGDVSLSDERQGMSRLKQVNGSDVSLSDERQGMSRLQQVDDDVRLSHADQRLGTSTQQVNGSDACLSDADERQGNTSRQQQINGSDVWLSDAGSGTAAMVNGFDHAGPSNKRLPSATAGPSTALPPPPPPPLSSPNGPPQLASTAEQRPTPGPSRQIPNLPPTATTVASFRELLLRRLRLIKNAESYYNLNYYLNRRDHQVANVIKSGNQVQQLSKGTMDLNRLMNRVSQETDFHKRKKRRKNRKPGDPETGDPPYTPGEEPTEKKEFDYMVLDSLRETRDFKLLESRFRSVFMWPALLATIHPPFERTDYTEKAAGHRRTEVEHPHFSRTKKQLPLLKSRKFYQFANKSKEEKDAIMEKRRVERIKKQVRELLADEDDPDPDITLDPDSDDPEAGKGGEPTVARMLAEKRQTLAGYDSSQRPIANTTPQRQLENDIPSTSVSLGGSTDFSLPRSTSRAAATESGGGNSVAEDNSAVKGNSAAKGRPKAKGKSKAKGGKSAAKKRPAGEDVSAEVKPKKKYKKRDVSGPRRHSSRFTERKKYQDRINKIQKEGPRKKPEPRKVPLTEPEKLRPRLSRYERNRLINAMVAMQDKTDKPSVTPSAKKAWHPASSYVSDDEDGVGEEIAIELSLPGRAEWEGLEEEQRESMVLLEQESIVENHKNKRPKSTRALSGFSAPSKESVTDKSVPSVAGSSQSKARQEKSLSSHSALNQDANVSLTESQNADSFEENESAVFEDGHSSFSEYEAGIAADLLLNGLDTSKLGSCSSADVSLNLPHGLIDEDESGAVAAPEDSSREKKISKSGSTSDDVHSKKNNESVSSVNLINGARSYSTADTSTPSDSIRSVLDTPRPSGEKNASSTAGRISNSHTTNPTNSDMRDKCGSGDDVSHSESKQDGSQRTASKRTAEPSNQNVARGKKPCGDFTQSHSKKGDSSLPSKSSLPSDSTLPSEIHSDSSQPSGPCLKIKTERSSNVQEVYHIDSAFSEVSSGNTPDLMDIESKDRVSEVSSASSTTKLHLSVSVGNTSVSGASCVTEKESSTMSTVDVKPFHLASASMDTSQDSVSSNFASKAMVITAVGDSPTTINSSDVNAQNSSEGSETVGDLPSLRSTASPAPLPVPTGSTEEISDVKTTLSELSGSDSTALKLTTTLPAGSDSTAPPTLTTTGPVVTTQAATTQAATLPASALPMVSLENLPMPNMASIPGMGGIRPSVALALPTADNKGLVFWLPNSADPNGPPIQLTVPLPIDPATGMVTVSTSSITPSSVSISSAAAQPTSWASSLTAPSFTSAASDVSLSSTATPAISSSFPSSPPSSLSPPSSSTAVSEGQIMPSPSSRPAIQGGVFSRIPADRQVVELDSDSDNEPSVAAMLASKRARTK